MGEGIANTAAIQVDDVILLAAGENHAVAKSIGALRTNQARFEQLLQGVAEGLQVRAQVAAMGIADAEFLDEPRIMHSALNEILERANLWLSECVLFVATIIRITHPNDKRLKKDRGLCASRVANRLAESGAYPMSPALGATSGNFELDAIQGSGVFLDQRARLLEYDVPTQVFSWKWGCIARNWACASAAAVR